jgi:magnesium chelatase subunit D
MSFYPFTAIVGQALAKSALLFNLVCPAIGGVLLAGEKGTAKSTMARSLNQLMPDLKVVTLPLNATEDCVVGTLCLSEAVQHGQRVFEPGILAAAHGHVLYVDEVNLLSESLVNVILDAAASGVNVVEREGISHSHPARFVLVGSMNPEEGQLKPQLLDRFGLVVPVSGSRALGQRIQVVKRRLAFERDAAAFIAEYRDQENALRARIVCARTRLPGITLTDPLLEMIAARCRDAFTAGHRADLVIAQAARARAALFDRDRVTADDVEAVAPMALLHRQRQPQTFVGPAQAERPASVPDTSSARADDALRQAPLALPARASEDDALQDCAEIALSDLSSWGELSQDEGIGQRREDQIFEVGELFEVETFLTPVADRRTRRRGSGRRSKTRTMARTGRYVRYRLPEGKATDIALDATLRAAAPHQRARPDNGLAIVIHASDIRQKVREKRVGNTILFLVDASGSMGAQRRMVAVKGAVLSLLQDAYQKRDTVGMMAFRGQDATLLLPPTRSIDLAHKLLRDLPVGGRTPLAAGIVRAVELVQALRVKDPDALPVVVLVSDGRANVALHGTDPLQDAHQAARWAAQQDVCFFVIDTETGIVRLGLAETLSQALGASCLNLEDLRAGAIAATLRLILE